MKAEDDMALAFESVLTTAPWEQRTDKQVELHEPCLDIVVVFTSVDATLAALKEAVFAGKVHFRYIDRILLEWSRNRVATVEQAKEYTQRFRNSR